MYPGKFETGSTHYMHLADPAEEDTGCRDVSKVETLSNEDDRLVSKLSSMASRGAITTEEYDQLARIVSDR